MTSNQIIKNEFVRTVGENVQLIGYSSFDRRVGKCFKMFLLTYMWQEVLNSRKFNEPPLRTNS